MVNCNKPNGKTFYDQLQELELLKGQFDEIFPFIHTDPRRLVDKDQNYLDTVKKYIENGVFNGFKIYPANGYFPFDIRLKPIYDLALKFNLPITTHCSIGPVYYRGKLSTFRNDGYFENGRFIHPFTGNELMGNNGKEFSPHFTHPLNYYCLMNEPDSLFRYWKKCEKILDFIPEKDYTIDDLKEYRKLKFCLGHFGGSEEWEKYLNDPWLPSRKNSLTIDEDLIHLSKAKWVHMIKGTDIDKLKPNSWHSIISDMIGKKRREWGMLFSLSILRYQLQPFE
jgi:Predicted metal-dependent hydrolase of the TIM-barrel fold